MKTFNPDKAVPVDESEDVAGLGTFLEGIDSKVKSMGVQIMADAFRELTQVAKRENAALLADAKKDFSEQVAGAVEMMESAVGKVDRKVTEAISHVKKIDGLAASLAKLETTVKAGGDTSGLLNAIGRVRDDLAAHEKARADAQAKDDAEMDDGEADDSDQPDMMASVLAEIKSLKDAPPPKRANWKFTVQRDDYNRISNVVATCMD